MATGICDNYVSRNNTFFVTSGFLTREKSGFYKLTDLGNKYAHSLDWGRLDDAKSQLRNILKEYKLMQIITEYIHIKGGIILDELVSRIAVIASVRRTKARVKGIKAFVDLSLFSNLLIQNNDLITVNKTIYYDKVKMISINDETDDGLNDKKKSEIKTHTMKSVNYPININININDFSNLENLREVLLMIKQIFGNA